MAEDWIEYWNDTCQRTLLTWDVLRRRGNIYFEHRESGKPPVLVFDYEMVLNAREFSERPVNYALVRILPPDNVATDAKKRPFVVVDPRAGHGPGIGGSKSESQIGMALRAGHPCYFVMFYPEPVPGRAILDIVEAEVKFLRHVADLHSDADGKPFVIGNCQAGWSLMMVAATHPDHVGPLLLAGSPLSYWAGVRGKNPMRYNGGLFGGSWLASLASDLGNGRFDGALLVQNFEMLNPANTFLRKQYDVYSNVDTEAERFLDFEKWWGDVFLMNKEEMRFIIDELFVGNKLAVGETAGPDGRNIDLRNIRSPIIVFASWGDNITPPQQALGWIPQLYESVEEIRANDQTIVYSLHPSVGHLGIFVSAKVAGRETEELFDALDLIDAVPPGLYELVITDTLPDTPHVELITDRYLYRLEARTLDDLLAYDDGRDDEVAFRTVKRLSESNEDLYDVFASPWVRAMSNETTAEALRASQPIRLQRSLLSDRNPWMGPIAELAEMARTQRAPVAADNAFLRWERVMAEAMEKWLDLYRDYRDFWVEAWFRSDTGLRTERRVSHCFLMDVPTLADLLIITDAAVNIAPSLAAKVDIAQNAIELAHAIGIEEPRLAVLSAVETGNPAIGSTMDAAALCKMADRRQISGAIMDGPLALDNAVSLEAARVKQINSAVAGRANILLVPDLDAGNMLAKSLTFLANADGAGIVLGARVPIILTSRADELATKLASCAVAALVDAARAVAPVLSPV
ncbi:MAG TPA: bifunctional enoyl-CoA hydratase/phosphate acetyltransferase [Burkholderiales bacterium]|nr:bifunctional enoyl-CoA hydratase/phosphate acetyltransferase [Burkholderiales bacterium]